MRHVLGLHDQAKTVGQRHVGGGERLPRNLQFVEHVLRPNRQRLAFGRRNARCSLWPFRRRRNCRTGIFRYGVGRNDAYELSRYRPQHAIHVAGAHRLELCRHIARRLQSLHRDRLTPFDRHPLNRVRVELELRDLANLAAATKSAGTPVRR